MKLTISTLAFGVLAVGAVPPENFHTGLEKAMVALLLALVMISDPAHGWLKFCGVTTVQGLQTFVSVVLKFIPVLNCSTMLPEFAFANCGDADARIWSTTITVSLPVF